MYASKILNEVEKKYQAFERTVEHFRKYIRSNKMIVRTDCAAFQWLHSLKVGARVMRWVLRLQFDLDIRHLKGKDATNADPMSRETTFGEDLYGGQEAQIGKLYSSMQKTWNDNEKKQKPMMIEKAAAKPFFQMQGRQSGIEPPKFLKHCLLGLRCQ